MYQIPTSLFKLFYGFFEGELETIVNCSLQMGTFPTALKMTVVRPLLKNNNLDTNILERNIFRTSHIIKNALFEIVNNARHNFDINKLTVLVLPELIVALDIVDQLII